MSWQTYVDTNLVGTGSVTKAAIVGHDGGSWAASAGFAVGADEAKALVAAFSVRPPLDVHFEFSRFFCSLSELISRCFFFFDHSPPTLSAPTA
jgi:profilin